MAKDTPKDILTNTPIVRDGVLMLQEPEDLPVEVVVGSPEWFAWLDHATRFVIEGLTSRFTARKKQRGGGMYWYIPFRRADKVSEAYLGRSTALTVEKLRTVVERIASTAQVPVRLESLSTSLSTRLSEFLEREAPDAAATDVESRDVESRDVESRDVEHIRQLVEAGTSVPPIQAKRGQRAHAYATISRAVTRRLTVLEAPPGYGKTSLLATWITASHVSAVWVTLEPGHNDETRFWTHVCVALDKMRPGILARLLPSIATSHAQHPTAVVDELIVCLAEVDDPTLLVLDDFHAIRGDNTPLLRTIQYLFEHAPAQVHVVVATRERVPFSLARMRAGGQLLELIAADLAFTRSEIAALFAQHYSRDLSKDEIEELYVRTHGWPIAITLAAQALTQPRARERLLDPEYHQGRFVSEYVVAEVLGPLPDDLQVFLMRVCVLDRLCAPLCDAVTGRRDSHALLAELVRRDLFILPLDVRGEWYRFHPMVAQALQRHLSETQPQLVPVLYARASEWCYANRFVREAIEYAFASHDLERVADLLELYTQRAWKYGRVATLRQFIERLPEELVRERPRLLLAHATTLILMRDRARLPERLREAEEALARAAGTLDPAEHASLWSELAVQNTYMRATFGEGAGEARVAGYEEALNRQPLGEVARGFVTMSLGIEQFLNGDVRAARATLGDLLAATRSGEQAIDYATCLLFLGYVNLHSGHLEEVLDLGRHGISSATHMERGDAAVWGVMSLLKGYVLYERNELDAAVARLEALLERASPLVPAATTVAVFPLLAFAYHAQGNDDAASETSEKGSAIWEKSPDVAPGPWAWGRDSLAADRAHLWLLQGKIELAAQWARQLVLNRLADNQPESARNAPSHVRELGSMVLARVYLAEGNAQAALEVLESLVTTAEAAGRMGRLIEMLVLQALAHHALQDQTAALRALARSVVLAAPEHYVRTFVDAGLTVKILLARLSSWIETHQLMSLISRDASRSRSSTRTAEEKAILNYIRSLTDAFGLRGHAAQDQTTQDQMAWSTATAQTMQLATRAAPTAPSIAKPEVHESLSARERDVLQALAPGRSNAQIATELYITEATVKRHVTRIIFKLEVQNRTQAVVKAISLGLIEPAMGPGMDPAETSSETSSDAG